MHRFVNKRVGLCIITLFLICLYTSDIDVYAANKDGGKCATSILSKIKIDYDGFSADTGKAMTISVTVPSIGSYEVQYNVVDYGEDAKDIEPKDIKTETISGTSWSKSISAGKEIFVFVTLANDKKVDDDTCHAAGTVSIDKNGNITNKKSTWKAESIQNPEISDVGNPVYDSNACEYMRLGKYKNNGAKHENDIVYSDGDKSHDYNLNNWNDYAEKYFPYCYKSGDTMSFTLSQKNINYVRKQLLEIYIQKKNIKTGGITISKGFENAIKKDDTDFGEDALLCDALPQKDSSGKFVNNDKKYYHEESKPIKNGNTLICTVTCREELEVIYSPPQVVKAGLCFQYEVTVKSKVQCKTEINKDAEPKAPDNFSAPIAICSGGSDQAGPNDYFDECITKCDGGKYSQSCINKCYKKIYKNNKKKTTNKSSLVKNMNTFDNDAKVQFLASDDDDTESYDIKGCKTNSEIWSNLDTCAKKIMEAKHQNPLGSYESGNDEYEKANVHWKPDWDNVSRVYKSENSNCKTKNNDCSTESFIESIKRAAPYYLRSVSATKNLITGLHGYETDRYKRYIVDNNGIKRQYSWRYQCGEKCGFKGKTGTIYNNKQAKKEYEASLEGYADALADCNAAAKCSEKTSTFNINVTNGLDKDNDGTCDTNNTCGNEKGCSWNATNTTGDTVVNSGNTLIFTPVKGDDSDINNGINGICYGNRKMPWQHYKTTITFPGSWINLKTGEVEYADPNKDDQYRKKTNYFCTPYNSCDVNSEWWKWYVSGTGIDSSYTPDVYNIGAKIEKFGKYNWNLDISCFYSAYNETIDEPDLMCYRGDAGTAELCNKTDDGKKEESTKLNYDIRVASLKTLFPNNRLRGYNWGSAAQLKSDDSTVQGLLNAGGYSIDPVKYSTEILGKGETGTYTESEKDLTVTLDADLVSDLKQNFQEKKIEFEGTYSSEEIIPGIRYYMMSNEFKNKYRITTKWSLGKNNGR